MKISRSTSGAPGQRGKAKSGNGKAKSANGKGGERLDPAVERWLAAASTEFAPSRSSAIPMLQSAQAVLGYLPKDAIAAIARHLKMSPVTLQGVASFYAQFRFNKPGRHRVTICRGTACYVRGSEKLMGELQADFRVAPGETTADGEVTLEAVSCFGACALAPVVVIDGTVNGRVKNGAAVKALVGAAGTQRRRARRSKAEA